MNKKAINEEIEKTIRKHFYTSLDLKLFSIKPQHIEVSFDPSLESGAEVTRGYPCKVVFGIGSLKTLKFSINAILQKIQRDNLIQPMAIVKYKHVFDPNTKPSKKWDRQFVHKPTLGVFRLLAESELNVSAHIITIMKHEESGCEVSFVGNNPNKAQMRIELSKKVADFYNDKMEKKG